MLRPAKSTGLPLAPERLLAVKKSIASTKPSVPDASPDLFA